MIENETVGEILKNARLKSKRSRELSTISRKLCIKEEYLTALENSDYSIFPESIYALGFARNYAIELGLDPIEVVKKVKQELNIEDTPVYTQDKVEEEMEKTSCFQDKNIKVNSIFLNFFKKYKSFYTNKRYITIFASFAVCTIILIWVMSAFLSKPIIDSTKDNEKSTVTESMMEALTAPAFSIPVKSEFGKENKSKSDFTIQAVEETWIKLEDKKSREVLFSRAMMPGDVYYVSNEISNLLTVGNAAGIVIYLHGAPMPAIGGKNVRLSQIPLNAETFASNNNSKTEK